MKARLILGLMLGISAFAGGALWYLQTRVYYTQVPPDEVEKVQLTGLVSDVPEPIMAENVKQISGPHMPLRHRACFETTHSLAMLTETYQIYDAPEPLIGPGWFSCFDAKAIGAELQSGTAIAFVGQAHIVYGVDRVVAVNGDGRGFVWHQLNPCGEAFYDEDPLPPSCPPAPDEAE